MPRHNEDKHYPGPRSHVHSDEPRVGDMALHRWLTLDPRKVSRVDGDQIWIDILGASVGPLPKENYTYTRLAE